MDWCAAQYMKRVVQRNSFCGGISEMDTESEVPVNGDDPDIAVDDESQPSQLSDDNDQPSPLSDDDVCIDFDVGDDDYFDSCDDYDIDTSKLPSTLLLPSNVEKPFMKFLNWLQSIDGGGKTLREAKKHKRSLVRMLQFDGQKVDVNNLHEKDFLRSYVDHQRKSSSIEDGTIRSYLASVKLYLDFELLDGTLTVDQEMKISNLLKQIRKWSAILYKGVEIRKYSKGIEDLQHYPTPAELCRFDSSKHTQSVLRKQISLPVSLPTLHNFTNSRDYVLSWLLVDNASRTGGVYKHDQG